jgi:hypothetical protein
MKLPFQDRLFQTNCKNCVFAVYADKTQTGCSNNRLKFFETIEAYDLEKEFYVVKGFCNYYRPPSWNSGVADAAKAKEESAVTFDLIIDCTQINQDYYDQICDLLCNINYNTSKYNIMFCHDYSVESSVKSYISNLYKLYPQSKMTIYRDRDLYLNTVAFKSKNTYHVYLNNNQLIDKNLFTNLNNEINDNVKKVVLAKNGTTYVVSNYAYKIISDYSTRLLYDHNIGGLIEKTKDSNMYIEL